MKIFAAIFCAAGLAAQTKPTPQRVPPSQANIGPITDADRLALKTAEAASWQAQAIYWQAQAQAAGLAQKASAAVLAHQQKVDELGQKCGQKKFDRETLVCEDQGTK